MWIFDKRVLLRLFGHNTVETRGGRRRQQRNELKNAYSSADIIGVVKSKERDGVTI
jgi:hypothetical protein